MDKLKTVQTDLETARKDFAVLHDELPRFHALVTDNEHDAEMKRRGRASLDDQAQAKNRVMVAREMLEQHQSDIATAQAEVSRLEGLESRELLLLEMAGHAEAEKQHKAVFDNLLGKLNKGLESGLEKLLAEYDTLMEHRQAFSAATQDRAVGAELAARGVSSPSTFLPSLPAPYGATVFGLLNSTLHVRAQQAYAAEQARKAAARAALRPKPAPPLREIEVSPLDAEPARRRLGELVQQVIRQSNGMLGKPDTYRLLVEPANLDEAVSRLEGKLQSGFEVRELSA